MDIKQQLCDKIIKEMHFEKLPDDVYINTMTIVCNINLSFNVWKKPLSFISTIKSVSFPGLNVTPPQQTIIRGKKIAYKPATPVQDIVASHEFTVTFRDVDGHANYMLMYDIMQKHYLDTENLFIEPFTIKVPVFIVLNTLVLAGSQ